MQFTLTLPSNSSSTYYPDNTAASFTTKLPEDINLVGGQWEVSLKEIQYPITWYNVHGSTGYVLIDFSSVTSPLVLQALTRVIAERMNMQIYFRAGYYSSGQQLAEEINFMLKASLPTAISDAVSLTYSIPAGKFSIIIGHGISVRFSRPLCQMMGLPPEMSISQLGHRVADLKRGIYSLYVYCDLCEEVIVGDMKVQLLRIVPINGEQGDYICHNYDFPTYTPLQTKNFGEIKILITDDAGKLIPFKSGKSIVTLHFRRKGFVL